MKSFLLILAVLLFATLPHAQNQIGQPGHTGNVSVLDDETVGTLPVQGGPGWTLDGPGVGTVTSIDKSASTMTSTWQSAGNMTQIVTTPRQIGESLGTQAARHSGAVQALKVFFPPVPAGG
jgi:hypothetical protein